MKPVDNQTTERIRKMGRDNVPVRDIARAMRVSKPTVSKILKKSA